jgi:phosphodiesterase/alkaline phosphatase D-like protein
MLVVALAITGCNSAVVISDVGVSGITEVAASITWDSSGSTTSQVEYGLTNAYGSETTVTTTSDTDHSVALTGLTAGSTYYYRAVSGSVLSDGGSFTTSATVANVISDVAISGIGEETATIAWDSSIAATSQV